MNALRPCRTAIQRVAPRAQQYRSRELKRRSFNIKAHRPSPLFLDFLAPSWSRPVSGSSAKALVPRTERVHDQKPVQGSRRLSTTSKRTARVVQNPRVDDDGKEMSIIITPRAAHRLATIAKKDNNPDLTLRVSVESGGCHGFQYLMKLESKKDIDAQEDTVFEDADVSGDSGFVAKVVMDEPSLELLKGSSVDYTMELIGSQFKVTGIPGATSSCGCGTSFDVAA